MDPAYACAELIWYLSHTPMTEMIKAYAPQYESFEWTEGRTYGAYGVRLTYNGMKETQIEMCIKRLREDVNTRQAQIVMWEKEDLITI